MQSSMAFVLVLTAVVLCSLPPPACAAALSTAGSTDDRHYAGEQLQEHAEITLTAEGVAPAEGEGTLAVAGEENENARKSASSQEKSEAELIRPIMAPFKQRPEEWGTKGISLTASGEPKSGTTWLARVIVELTLQLCGNVDNTWCTMGGLTTVRKPPAPEYKFEMLHAETRELFLHFEGKRKHEVFGLEAKTECWRGGEPHRNTFGKGWPCRKSREMTREALMACLPRTSPDCVAFLPPLDPALRRMAVIFRDARNVVVSEHRMRTEAYHQHVGELEPFIHFRFESIVAWIHQRWVWHTTTLEDVSRIMFYEDLQAHPHHLVGLAAFVGLNCTTKEADRVWQMHTYPNPPGDYATYDLSIEILEWMNATMAKLLPEAVLDRYGLAPMYP